MRKRSSRRKEKKSTITLLAELGGIITALGYLIEKILELLNRP